MYNKKNNKISIGNNNNISNITVGDSNLTNSVQSNAYINEKNDSNKDNKSIFLSWFKAIIGFIKIFIPFVK